MAKKKQDEANQTPPAGAETNTTPAPATGTSATTEAAASMKAAEKPAEVPAHAAAKMATRGRIVDFHQEQMGSIGKLETFSAMVLGEASKESNFKPEDMAVDLYVFKRNRAGGCIEKQGVMYSAEPKAGRWSWGKNQ